jgi:5-methylcytosine-specific restriction endonuclease McrA
MKEQILQLRKEGKSYNEIQNILKCSKGTIAYHCGDGQKLKSQIRVKSYKKTLNGILKRKKDNFSVLNRRDKSKKKRSELAFSSKEFKNKIENNPICYLTGRKINLLEPKTYQCDHIIPVSKGGNCELSNLGLACKDANMAKGDLLIDKFIDLCKDVLVHNGYTVEKNLEG